MLLPSALGFSPHPPVSVYGTGTVQTIAAFPGTWSACFPTFVRSHITSSPCMGDLPPIRLPRLYAAFRSAPMRSTCVPTVLSYRKYRNLNLLSIGYALRPRLRPRLTQSRSALLWKPWIFGRKDSHLPLATHSGILSSIQSTAPSGTASSRMQCSSTNLAVPQLRCRVSAPDIFGAGPLDQ